ncbi:MmgE/PrpD family protein [Brenneria nigrifluens]|uniref:MmgE/PrpD family protein n=1 Tax=Brenneria nigrifluens DSM 30175 = ATCC 13028 TaxID=1121120 RepID=A0A2U1UVR6_9GAMM|nr:MmgE/PrpD family protein [Brenneria nigrifluens] [Brenneria nigrifluens DSM 30175 = ATCC 13028]QCR06810.1 MmgE/PrpD family protein [Brenneria nigrifluens] [Brenneria nigrifluens DSM 30175 = ATCC 13028]
MADWLAALTPEAIPEPVRRVAQRCLVDTLGVMLAGSETRVAGLARAVAEQSAAFGRSEAVGCNVDMAAPAAAFVNATAAHALDFDDNCYAGFAHGSAVIVPAALALAQSRCASGAALITALAAGSECQYRLAQALGTTLYERGWWTTGVLGAVGACAAAARLLELDASATAQALGLAIAGTGGMKSVFGSDAKPLLAGRASEAGVIAALLAGQGASGPTDAVEHPYGLAALCNAGRFTRERLEAGDNWCLLNPGIDVKRLPVCLSSHAAVDGVMELIHERMLDTNDVVRIVCDVPPLVAANLIYPQPLSVQQAQFSLPFAIAASLSCGELTLDCLNEETVRSPALAQLMEKVAMTTGPRWRDAELLRRAPEGAAVTLEMADGTKYERFTAQARGTSVRPLSDEELSDKFRRCAGRVMGAAQTQNLLDRLWGAETLPNLDDILALRPTRGKTPDDV